MNYNYGFNALRFIAEYLRKHNPNAPRPEATEGAEPLGAAEGAEPLAAPSATDAPQLRREGVPPIKI